jgi:uncharacterized protein with NRDE domain
MCTVTFIPQGKSCFITSNRDESPGRQAKGLTSFHDRNSGSIHYPLDESSGGSWIALSDQGRAVCLLNGGFEAFVPNPPYRMSRGQIVISAAMAQQTETFISSFDLTDIAPFTLLVYERDQLSELVWDGEQKHIRSLPVDQQYIWSSATLYSPKVRAWRKSLFDDWRGAHDYFDRESIISFHQMTNGDQDNDFVMNRHDMVKTLSITSIYLNEKLSSLLHLDLEQKTREEILIRYDR